MDDWPGLIEAINIAVEIAREGIAGMMVALPGRGVHVELRRGGEGSCRGFRDRPRSSAIIFSVISTPPAGGLWRLHAAALFLIGLALLVDSLRLANP